jgi:two-component SAPR family response regulator
VLLLDDHIITRDFYGVEMQEEHNKLEVYTLGPGFVLIDSHAIDEWEGHLPRLLFFFALDRPVVTRSEICQAFWPELEDDQAVNVFHVTKRRLHKALDADILVHDNGYYKVNPELGVYFDGMEFVTALVAGRDPNNPDRIEAWQKAIDLYRGPFLQGHDDTWILHRREDFRAGYLEAMLHTAHVWIERDKREHALSLLLRAGLEDPRREDVLREIMKLYVSLGRRSEAAAQYQKLFSLLRNEALEPEPETQHLYAEISS